MSYAAPKSEVSDYEQGAYRDTELLTQWTLWLLYAEIAISILAIWSGYEERQTLHALAFGAFGSEEASVQAAERSDARQGMLGLAQMAVYITGGVFILRWIHRMAHNARVKATYMQYTPGWCVGWYFVPIALWWKPFQAMTEVWETTVQQAGSQARESAGLLGLWWTLWILYSIVSNASFRMTLKVQNIPDALDANAVTIASDIASIPLCIVFVVMVNRLTRMQDYAREHAPTPPPAGAFPGANW